MALISKHYKDHSMKWSTCSREINMVDKMTYSNHKKDFMPHFSMDGRSTVFRIIVKRQRV
ncbi:hypothetical protein GBA52_017418 [Prunus armeniaca]|nr:hypothetical protein GBA52_017418 [Prunus armeniaca]